MKWAFLLLCFNLGIVNNQEEMSRFSLDAELWSWDRSAFDLCWTLAQPGLRASHLTDSSGPMCRYQACVRVLMCVCARCPPPPSPDSVRSRWSPNFVKCEHQLPHRASWCARVSTTKPHRLGAAPRGPATPAWGVAELFASESLSSPRCCPGEAEGWRHLSRATASSLRALGYDLVTLQEASPPNAFILYWEFQQVTGRGGTQATAPT